MKLTPKLLKWISYLNGRDAIYADIQKDIDRTRRKYFDLQEIQFKLDLRQAELDKLKKEVAIEKAKIFNPN